MPTDATITQIQAMFSRLRNRAIATAIPGPGTLSAALTRIVESTPANSSTINGTILSLFATAAVEMWHRSVHSFLISASLTKASPLWASVSGYYSSHYTIRALGHLLGYFHLRSKKRILQVEVSGGQYICHIIQGQVRGGEHKFYWKVVKEHAKFATDPFFTKNEEGQPRSDCAHRNKANYADHLNKFPIFQVLDQPYLETRVETIAGIRLSDVPIPDRESYPDIDNVQLIAYHRIVKFRKFVDDSLGGGNPFWRVQRKPDWCPSFLSFQVVEPEYTSVYGEQLS